MDANAPSVCDATHMARAIALAERGRTTTAPNPMVGCVITNGGVRVGEGWHERAGGAHAEVAALSAAGRQARGATVYVTLEPCAHQGRTPPCTTALSEAGVARVVFGLADPNPAAAGGQDRLELAGIEVSAGLLGAYVRAQNRVFLHNLRTGRPHLTLKLAQTPRGELSVPDRRWITAPAARRHVHVLRARADAVLVGIGTVLADDPRLDVRDAARSGRQPRAVVVDSSGRTPTAARVVRPGTIVVTTPAAGADWRRAMSAAGVEVVVVGGTAAGRVDLERALTLLPARGIHAVVAEPGPTLAGALVADGLVDRCVVHVAGAAPPERFAACLDRPAGAAWRTVMRRPVGGDREIVLVPDGGA